MISTRHLYTAFGARTVLHDVSLSIRHGIYALLGPNGAGKTTLIQTLLGLLPMQRGQCMVAGLDVSTDAAVVRSRCGALLESTGLYGGYSVARNLAYHASLHGLHGKQLRQRIGAVSEQFGLSPRMRQPCAELSRGWRKKVALARAMVHRPKVLFLDEPTNGLDPASADELCHILRELRDHGGVTILLTTHLLSEAESLCDSVGVLVEGRLTFSGKRNQLQRGHESALVLRCESRPDEPQLRRITATTGLPLAIQRDGSIHCKLALGQRPSAALGSVIAAGLAVVEASTKSSSLLQAYRKQLDKAAP